MGQITYEQGKIQDRTLYSLPQKNAKNPCVGSIKIQSKYRKLQNVGGFKALMIGALAGALVVGENQSSFVPSQSTDGGTLFGRPSSPAV